MIRSLIRLVFMVLMVHFMIRLFWFNRTWRTWRFCDMDLAFGKYFSWPFKEFTWYLFGVVSTKINDSLVDGSVNQIATKFEYDTTVVHISDVGTILTLCLLVKNWFQNLKLKSMQLYYISDIGRLRMSITFIQGQRDVCPSWYFSYGVQLL